MLDPHSSPSSLRLLMSLVLSVCAVLMASTVRAQPSNSSIPPTAWFGLGFDSSFSSSPSGWSYLSSDLADTVCGITSHSGLLVLPGHSQPQLSSDFSQVLTGPYVNLSTTGGNNGFTSQLPGNIGGTSAGVLAQGTAGWSFEVAFKPSLVETWGKIFDLGQPQLANGNCQYDIILGWDGSGPTMQFDVCDGNGVQYQMTDALGNIFLNQWYHAIIVIQQQSNGLANYYSYVDGALYNSITQQYYPQSVPRSNGNIGHSDWQADSYWAGELDYFYIYNQALTPQQVASRYASTFGSSALTCTATGNPSLTIPIPFYSLNFNVDPRIATQLGSAATYSWVAGDSSDSLYDSQLHQGLLYFPGSSQSSGQVIGTGPYVNLSASGGNQWIGSTLPTFGGLGTGNITTGTAGWSFEVTFKALSQTVWAKIFDLGDPQLPSNPGYCYYDVVLGWNGGATTLQFAICGQSAITPTQQIVLGQWYHAVVVLQLTIGGGGNFFLYVNGELQGSLTMQYYLVSMPRVSAALGYSNWGDALWNGYIDTFNVYSQAISQQQVTLLYTAAMVNVSSFQQQMSVQSPTVPTPWFTAPFTTSPVTSSSSFSWLQQDPADVQCGISTRTGLLVLPGRDTPVTGNAALLGTPAYINLASSSGANSIGSTLPGNIGGVMGGSVAAGTAGWSFEVAFKPGLLEQWAKLFDLGQPQTSSGACQYDILWGWNYLGSQWQFDVCDGSSNQYAIPDSLGPVQLGVWTHAVAVIQLLPSGQANYYTYVNGQLYGTLNNAYYPAQVSRPNAYLGRSGWGSDSYWAGEVDVLNIYSQALTAQQVAAAYTAQQSAVAACPSSAALTSTLPSTSFSLTFAQDPRVTTGLGTSGGASYSWLGTDPTDSTAVQAYHSGLLVLSGGANSQPNSGPYVNLSASSGPNWVGQTLGIFGGAGTGSLQVGSQGWSVEVVFKAQMQTPWAKVFSLGNGGGSNCLYDLVFGWNWDTTKTQFDLCDASANQYALYANPTIIIGQWYHVIAVMQLDVSGLANYNVYYNGVLAGSLASQTYLIAAPRNNAELGYSNWGDALWIGEIDTFNIYPQALNQLQVYTAYQTAMGPQATPPALVTAPSTAPSPWFSAPFDSSFSTSPSGWSYLGSDPVDVSCGLNAHTGLLLLPGRTQPGNGDPYGYTTVGPYVNYGTTGGNNGWTSALPGMIGGVGAGNVSAGTAGWTFEVAFKPTLIEQWAKVFDFGQSQIYGGLCQYDILWGWDYLGSTWQFDVCDGGGNQYAITDSLGPVFLGQWYHAVVVIQLLPSGLATYYTYVNGQFYTSLADVYYPDMVPRWNANMGKSNWIADTYFAGEVDFFNIYNQALTPQQVSQRYTATFGSAPASCPTTTPNTALSPPVPFFGLNFSTDPRQVTGLGFNANYQWLSADPADYLQDQATHQGLISLLGSYSGSAIGAGPYINLSASSGGNWVGATLPQFGGLGTGSLLNGTQGWSVEVVFKARQATQWAKIFDLGNPQTSGGVCYGDVQFGFYQSSTNLQYNYCDDSGTIVSTQVTQVGRWYHVVVVQQLTKQGTGNFMMYINGDLQGQNTQQIYPVSVPRVSATLGFSNWGDAFFVGLYDTFNIYSVALMPQQVVTLYQAAMLPSLALVTATANAAAAIPPTPWFALPFTSQLPTSSNYLWLQTDPYDTQCGISWHTGILQLQGHDTPNYASGLIGPYVNLALSSGSNSVGSTLPSSNIGGAGSGILAQGTMGWTFEVLFKPSLIEQWSKVFDIGNPQLPNGQCQHDISLGWNYLGPTWQFNVCDGNGNGWAIADALGLINVQQWYHAVVVIQALQSGQANYYTYVNGALYATFVNAYYPPNLPRTDAYMGRSDWSPDSYWAGEVDTFNIYSQALTQQQITVLFQAAQGGNQLNPTACPITANTQSSAPPLYFSATFAQDPRGPSITNLGNTASYSWVLADPTDSSTQQSIHSGLLVLNGSRQSSAPNAGPYANLSASAGINWIGQTLGLIGGLGSGNFWQSSAGWTFEVVFKPQAQTIWAKVFDIGNPGACDYDILFGWNAATLGLQFDICNGAYTQFQLFPPTQLNLSTWYHAVVTQTLLPTGLSTYFVYINGQLVGASADQNYPIAAPRYNSVLGYSNWADPFWVGEIDTFNVYNQSINQQQAYNMYTQAMQQNSTSQLGIPTPGSVTGTSTNSVGSSSSSSSSGLSNGAKAGIALGVIIGAELLLILLLALCGYSSGRLGGGGGKSSSPSGAGAAGGASGSKGHHELEESQAESRGPAETSAEVEH